MDGPASTPFTGSRSGRGFLAPLLPLFYPFVDCLAKGAVLKNRDERIRTSGPFVPNEVRYQAALHPAISSI